MPTSEVYGAGSGGGHGRFREIATERRALGGVGQDRSHTFLSSLVSAARGACAAATNADAAASAIRRAREVAAEARMAAGGDVEGQGVWAGSVGAR